jgi:hypothetical protein
VSAFNALTDGYVSAPEPTAPPSSSDNAGATSGAAMGPSPSQMGPNIAALQGMPPLTGDHNIPLQVGFLGILALGVVIALRLLGFKFSAAGSLGSSLGVGRG